MRRKRTRIVVVSFCALSDGSRVLSVSGPCSAKSMHMTAIVVAAVTVMAAYVGHAS
jgi:hypothetical protein